MRGGIVFRDVSVNPSTGVHQATGAAAAAKFTAVPALANPSVAGVIANFVTWRIVYWLALGLQACVLLLMYFKLPDFPSKNKGMTYFGILYTMAKFAVTEPLLIQAVLISTPSSACFTNWWVTLTFLLGGPPYNYPT